MVSFRARSNVTNCCSSAASDICECGFTSSTWPRPRQDHTAVSASAISCSGSPSQVSFASTCGIHGSCGRQPSGMQTTPAPPSRGRAEAAGRARAALACQRGRRARRARRALLPRLLRAERRRVRTHWARARAARPPVNATSDTRPMRGHEKCAQHRWPAGRSCDQGRDGRMGWGWVWVCSRIRGFQQG